MRMSANCFEYEEYVLDKKNVMDSPSYKLFNIPKFITVDDVLERDVMNSELIKFLYLTENSTFI